MLTVETSTFFLHHLASLSAIHSRPDPRRDTSRIATSDDDEPSAPASAKVDALGNLIVDDTPAPSAFSYHDGPSSDSPAGTEGGDEFADLKKKKKKGSKKAAFDLEAFEKEIAEGKEGGEDGAEGGEDGEDGLEGEDVPEGEDPFKGEGEEEGVSKAIAAAEAKLWLKEGDRDYHYTEVRSPLLPSPLSLPPLPQLTIRTPTAPRPVLHAPLRVAPIPLGVGREEEVHARAAADAPRGQQALHLCQRRRHLQEDAPPARARHPVPLCGAGHEW